jgi:tetratricopeptide (TPR) repeat protein
MTDDGSELDIDTAQIVGRRHEDSPRPGAAGPTGVRGPGSTPDPPPGGTLDRRRLLQSSAILLGGEVSARALKPVSELALSLAETLEKARITPAVLEEIELSTNYYSQTFDQHDFEELHAALMHHLGMVQGLLRRPATYRQRGELCLHGAQISGMLALLTHMQGNLSESLGHYRNAYTLAEEIGDREFMSWVLAERAAVAWSVGNAKAVLALTDGVVDGTSGANRANMVSNLAQAYARTNDRGRAIKLIAEAESAAESIPQEQNSDLPGTPIWGFSPSSTITNTAISWLHLDEPQRALASAQRSVVLLGEHALHRHVAHAKIIMATAHVGLGSPEEACRIATDVILSAPQDVYIVSRQSMDLLRALNQYRSTPEVRQLREVIAHYEHKLESRSRPGTDPAG